MARVALLKLFTGLNLGICQLSGELQRAGHETIMVYLKEFGHVARSDLDGADPRKVDWRLPEHTLPQVGPRGREYYWTAYKPFTDVEYALLLETLREFRPDLIGFSLCSVPIREAAEVTRFLRKHFDVPVIWGGSGPTVEPDRCLEHADMVCVGEGEELILEVAERIDQGQREFIGLGNLWSKKDGVVVKGPKRPLVDIETIAIPDFDPVRTVHIRRDHRLLNRYPLDHGRHYHIMTQRGCPFSCSFCIESLYQEMWGKAGSLRRRSVDSVIEELAWAKKKFTLTAVMFLDDVFTVNPRWIREFASKYKEAVGLPFWGYTYPRTTRLDELLLLKDAGMAAVTVGVQSGSEELLDGYNRPVSREQSIRAAEIIMEAGLDGYFDLITGSELETEEDCRRTFEFLMDFPRPMQVLNVPYMVGYPGYKYTELASSATPGSNRPSAETYAYYHRLYLLTRTTLPREDIRAIAESEIIRKYPEMMEALLPERFPFHVIVNGSIDLAAMRPGDWPLPPDTAGPPPDHARRERPRAPVEVPRRSDQRLAVLPVL